jgi:hypothetical protein
LKKTSISNHNFNNDKSIDEADEDRDKFLEIKLSDPTKGILKLNINKKKRFKIIFFISW